MEHGMSGQFQTILPDRVDLSLDIPAQSMIGDGFAMNANIRYLPKRYYDFSVKQLEWLRSAVGAMYPRQYPVPLVAGTAISAFSTYPEQYRITPGSWIWGWDMTVVSGTIGNVYVQMTDPCTKRQIWSSYVNAAMLTSSSNARRPRVLPHPYQIDSDGLIDIQIKNNSASDLVLTFCFMTAEPAGNLGGTIVPPDTVEVL